MVKEFTEIVSTLLSFFEPLLDIDLHLKPTFLE